MEIDALAERILGDINSVFKRDPYVDEFDIVPVFEAQNKSPVVHVGHKLALESWCVKHLYYYCYNKLFDWREKKRKIEPEKVLRWTTAVLLLNPDIQTAWNVRKEMLIAGQLLPRYDLRCAYMMLTRKPKSPEVYAHRKWILSCILTNRLSCQVPIDTLIDHELELCTVAASRYQNNYHAWSHRIWVLKELAKHSNEVLTKELAVSEEWILTHVSDHSGMQYRQHLLDILMTKPTCHDDSGSPTVQLQYSFALHNSATTNGDGKSNSSPHPNRMNSINLLSKELELSSELIFLYPGHETLWYHRRYVMHACKRHGLLDEGLSVKYPASFGPSCKKTKLESCWSHGLSLVSLERELGFLDQCSSRCEDGSVQLDLALKYKKWLTTCLQLTVEKT